MFGKSARRTGNIYVAPTELIAFLDNDSYKDIAPTELVPSEPKVRIGREFPPLLQSRLAFYVPVGPL
jgi:hypothetical protein